MDKDKFLAIISEHRNLIYKICCSYCSELENRNDLQQDILLQLWKSMDKYDKRSKLSTWIYRISLNTAISFYRKNRKHQENTSSIDNSLLSLPCSEDMTEQDEKITVLYQFINQLNEFDKAVMLLYLDDNSYEEIAEIVGITKTNVATKISRIKKSIKEKINNNH